YLLEGVGAMNVTATPQTGGGFADSQGKITWNPVTSKLDIAAGLPVGTYKMRLTLQDESAVDHLDFTLDVQAKLPSITGNTSLTLSDGYASTQTSPFTVTGSGYVSVTVIQDPGAGYPGYIYWNNATKSLKIDAGVPVGVYHLTLRAQNGYPTIDDPFIFELPFTLTVEPKFPVIIGDTAKTVYLGYTATETNPYSITGTITEGIQFVTLISAYPQITYSNSRITIAPGLGIGTYTVKLRAANIAGAVEYGFTLTVKALAPQISGVTKITLPIGYAETSTAAYEITGSAPLNVTLSNDYGGKLVWNSGSKTVTIKSGLSSGMYTTVLRATNGTPPNAELVLTIIVGEPPEITGPSQMTLTLGYAATSTGAFGLFGDLPSSAISLNNSYGGMITWNVAAKKLNIAAGLGLGEYPVTLSGTVGDMTANKTFTLSVIAPVVITPAPKISGPAALEVTRWYKATSTGAYTITDAAASAVTQNTTHGGKITWNAATRKLDIAPGLSDGVYSVTLSVTNATGTASTTFKLTVKAPANPFTDIKPGDWYYDNVLYAYYNGLFSGVTDTTFGPGVATTRAMVVMVLYKLAGAPKVTGSSGFTDVASSDYFSTALTWGVQNKIVSGVGEGLYAPYNQVTRQDFAVILYKYALYDGKATGKEVLPSLTFADTANISDYARKAVAWCYANGIVTGKSGNTFDPKGQATRAEVATMLRGYMNMK
ncbi:MAG: S-layer homology domain-containing protein, partial [Oscillospiraceae bacterium]|nr:S-layer homology domain-containing protein [Oscillospiraceae bacterium]